MPPSGVTLPFSGERLRDVRERAGVSIGDLAARCAALNHPVSKVHISRVERGKCRPSAPLLKAFRLALEVELDALLDPAAKSA
jgi:transcriptional regulator with XRE-family HTH domain